MIIAGITDCSSQLRPYLLTSDCCASAARLPAVAQKRSCKAQTREWRCRSSPLRRAPAQALSLPRFLRRTSVPARCPENPSVIGETRVEFELEGITRAAEGLAAWVRARDTDTGASESGNSMHTGSQDRSYKACARELWATSRRCGRIGDRSPYGCARGGIFVRLQNPRRGPLTGLRSRLLV